MKAIFLFFALFAATLAAQQDVELPPVEQLRGTFYAQKRTEFRDISSSHRELKRGKVALAADEKLGLVLDRAAAKDFPDDLPARLKELPRLAALQVAPGCEVAREVLCKVLALGHWRELEFNNGVDAAVLEAAAGNAGLEALVIGTDLTLKDETLKPLAKLATLREFRLASNRHVTAAGLAFLAANTAMEYLDLSAISRLDDAVLGSIKGLTKLRYLDIHGAEKATAAAIAGLDALVELRELNLAEIRVVDARALACVRAMKNLETLRLNRCPSIDDAALENLRGCAKLVYLNLWGCAKVTDAGLAHLAGLGALEKLLLEGAAITDEGLKSLAALTALETLDLIKCKNITGAGIAALKPLKKMRSLNLTETAVGDDALPTLKGFSALKFLHVTRTKLSSEAVADLKAALPELRTYGG